ncbi:MAG: TetR/AcrR family transcriptional regulator [Firmicutes bacterium]|jgi:AcrR family transcriptional regulator|nr:TetR/AcrR family transcriptional regulator [Bacillota bacterium]
MKDKILDAVVDLINMKGVKFTMDDIARSLSISKRTIYENFSSKEEIIDQLVDKLCDRIRKREIEILRDPDMSVDEKLRDITKLMAQDLRITNEAHFYDIKKFYPEQWKKFQEVFDDWEPTFEILNIGVEKGILRRFNPFVLRKLLSTTMISIMDKNFLDESGLTFDECFKEMLDIVSFGIVRDGELGEDKK